jgi:hypothetical protein
LRKKACAASAPRLVFFRVFHVFRGSNLITMKSAYELAMERLAKSDPESGRKLTDEQKGRLAEIDRVYQGKIAEREIFLKKQLNEALAAGNADEYQKIQQQIVSERARLEEEREDEKERERRAK